MAEKAEHVELLPTHDGDIISEIQNGEVSRRNFLVAAGFAGMGVFGGVRALQTLTDKVPILVNSNGVLIHEPARCVDCRRCEMACTEFNNGFGSSYLARCKIGRNAGWAPGGRSFTQGTRGPETNSGDWRMAGETCKQCPHPVPCAEACPRGAIERNDVTGARKINEDKCIGCGICNVACPWGMPTLDKVRKKSVKCFLCDGSPECAHACPTGAMKFVAWRDTRSIMPMVKQGIMPASTTTNCSSCHANQM
jgi:Fe-S-cluster-containing dehydrogenase component